MRNRKEMCTADAPAARALWRSAPVVSMVTSVSMIIARSAATDLKRLAMKVWSGVVDVSVAIGAPREGGSEALFVPRGSSALRYAARNVFLTRHVGERTAGARPGAGHRG